MPLSTAILETALAQRGLILRRQLAALGMSDHELRHRLQSEGWQRPYRSVYALPGAQLDDHAVAFAAVISTPAPAAASHVTALKLWGAPVPFPKRPDVLTPYGHHQRDTWLNSHRTRLWRFFDVTNLDGLQITTPVRSLIDASLALSVDELGKAIDALRRDNLLDLNALADRVASIKSGRGRGLNRLGLALELRDPNVPAGDSPLETQLNEILSKAGLGGFVTQYEIRTSSGRYRADLAYVEERIVVEADGWSVHGNRTAFDADRERQNAIANAGYLVLRFTSRSSPDRIVSAVRQALLLRRSEVA